MASFWFTCLPQAGAKARSREGRKASDAEGQRVKQSYPSALSVSSCSIGFPVPLRSGQVADEGIRAPRVGFASDRNRRGCEFPFTGGRFLASSLRVKAGHYLLVDAHNVICATGWLRRTLEKGHDAARNQLAERLRAIRDAEGLRVAMILDSANERLEVERPFGEDSFECLYAPAGLTADGVIERIARRARDPSKVTVASNDNLVRETVRSVGAIVLRTEELLEWAQACEERLARDARLRRAVSAKKFRNGIDL